MDRVAFGEVQAGSKIGSWPVWFAETTFDQVPKETAWVRPAWALWRLAMGTNVYVGNLSFDVTSEQLEEMFAEFGEVVSGNVITDRDTGRSRGFGFVEMADGAAAAKAIEALNGKDMGGRALTVNEARPREDRGRGGGGGGGGGRGGRGGGGGGGRRF